MMMKMLSRIVVVAVAVAVAVVAVVVDDCEEKKMEDENVLVMW